MIWSIKNKAKLYYCSSLCIYYTKTIVSKLHKCYYACIYRLFKFNLVDCSVQSANSYLQRFGLSSLQYRIFLKLSTFFYNLKQQNSQANLYSLLTPQRREVCYNLRNPIQLVKPLSSKNTQFCKLTISLSIGVT